MAIRHSLGSDYRLYDASKDAAFHEADVAMILFCCGLDGRNVNQYTIDEILDKIGEVYPDNSAPMTDYELMAKAFKPAASCFVMKQNLTFTTFLKRAWRNLALAKLRMENVV